MRERAPYRCFFYLTMINAILGRFSTDMGVDLGTTSTLVYIKDKGIVINEPSLAVINTRSDQIVAVGEEAKKMLGKTPPHLVISRPIENGVISDFEVTEKMLRYFIEKIHHDSWTLVPRPRVVIAIPMDVTEVERKAVEDATLAAGAREVSLIESPMAAAIGSRLPIQEPNGLFIVDIGGGTIEIALISLGGIVTRKTIRSAGDDMTVSIIQYIRENFNLLIGEKTAESVKIKIGSVLPLREPMEMRIQGRDLFSGLPKELAITDAHVRDAIEKQVRQVINTIKQTVELSPPELVADMYRSGILLTGGGSLLRGLDKRIYNETQIPVSLADDPITAVVRGTGIVLEDLDLLGDVLLPPAQDISSRR
ncbi:MAG: Cell shape determining protein, MreB/Mrl family [Parcubacteria group bacterium GW2011_GWA2_43_13]|nr:MAG: Cell shape determining protein, MreB/Mrl family [Parcubacteria group bacterium GW2011_GWA2_43_13]